MDRSPSSRLRWLASAAAAALLAGFLGLRASRAPVRPAADPPPAPPSEADPGLRDAMASPPAMMLPGAASWFQNVAGTAMAQRAAHLPPPWSRPRAPLAPARGGGQTVFKGPRAVLERVRAGVPEPTAGQPASA